MFMAKFSIRRMVRPMLIIAVLGALAAGPIGASAFVLDDGPSPAAAELAPNSAPSVGSAETDSSGQDEPVPADPQAIQHYFVILEGTPLASYRSGIPGLAGTAAEMHGDVHLDPTTPAAVSYLAYLDAERARFQDTLRNIAPEAEMGWQYRYVLHGFSADMTPASAAAMASQPGVRLVHPAEELDLDMDSTADLVNMQAAWDYAGGLEEAGLNARIAILDTGGMAGHPWFNDDGMAEAPEGYPNAKMVSRDGTALDYPEPERFTNNKVIGGRTFVRTASVAAMNTNWPTACSTGGCSSHGVHVAGIANGRFGAYDYPLGSTRSPCQCPASRRSRTCSRIATSTARPAWPRRSST